MSSRAGTDLQISGRTALVMGGDSVIGWHTAKLLLAEGAEVAITDVDQPSLVEAAAKLPGEVLTVAADLTDADH